jgi:LytR cell envelope-related transcriptional attenuator
MTDDFAEDAKPRRSAAQINIVRASAVVACFVAATIWLLGPASNYSAGAPTSTTPTTHPAPPVVRSETTLQVANGTVAPNAARSFSHQLTLEEWNVRTPVDTTPPPTKASQYPVTYVYFHPHQQAAAQVVAAQLTVPPNHVLLRTQAVLHAVPGSGATDVIVILGTDLTHS